MARKTTPWLELLEGVRPHLSGRDHRGAKGSLRWLEAVMAERGGRAGAVRNILYKDLGAPEEKARLYGIIAELYREAGLNPPAPPVELALERARRVLGRDKRRYYRRFIRALSQGERPQMIVVGEAATGKGVLLAHVREAVPEAFFVNVAGDLGPALYSLAELLDLDEAFEALLARLSPVQPYAVQAALQGEVRALFAKGLNARGRVLLLRAERDATIADLPLRDADGNRVRLAAWLEPLLEALEVPYLAALSEPPPKLSYQLLKPPSRQEARRYVSERLPHLKAEEVEAIVNRAGRHYGELSRLTLLEAVRHGDSAEADLEQDPRMGPLVQALAVLSPDEDPAVPVPLLEQVIGRTLGELSKAEQALIAEAGEGYVRPAVRAVLPERPRNARCVHAEALAYYTRHPHPFRQLYHALGAEAYEVFLELVEEDPMRLALVPGVWGEAAAWPLSARLRLANAVIRYRAVLGEYTHPEVREALELLANAPDPELRAWARIKAAEAYVDQGRYAEAAALIQELPHLKDEARAEALLVQAALERWRGAYDRAERAVREALALSIPPFLLDRARLWQGVVAKDAGRMTEALEVLKEVRHNPLAVARARYQEGDLLMRLGRAEEAVTRIETALQGLEAVDAPLEERSRVRARLGTVLRRLARYDEGARHLYAALECAPDPFTRARVASEAAILEAARGRGFEAVRLAAEAEAFFRMTSVRPEEARYRHRRTLFRLAMAFWVLGTGQPYRAPFRGSGSVEAARRLLEPLFSEVAPLASTADRYRHLLVDVALGLALVLPAAEAAAMLEPLLEQPQTYLAVQVRLGYAEALLRGGRPELALRQTLLLPELPPEPGLGAWKLAIEAEALLRLEGPQAAERRLGGVRALPAPLRAQVGRVLGRALLDLGLEAVGEAWAGGLGPLGLPEGLALAFERAAVPAEV
ncbi:tetratricopeptide repeat protein [Marinithermus hydrothermalis]|uniref:TPR repeat-containing protein n=1 Tax=Marinithermus hydrothermalis (strain DSM 14884 / JCM 11576 / T1) TaxID=869210 RepID=F2NQK7_MARHT|nr:tetratricopeptide repeat protein [Marinithermus hydrothermalis]AEB11945.1 TPR repeat-containing protein [Marinithermus hydrothermalis DSM 14884]